MGTSEDSEARCLGLGWPPSRVLKSETSAFLWTVRLDMPTPVGQILDD